MEKNDFVRLKHMLEAAYVCLQFANDKKREDLEKDQMLSFAIIRALEIFGEAAASISKQFQKNIRTSNGEPSSECEIDLFMLILISIMTLFGRL